MATKQTPAEGDVERALPTDLLSAIHEFQRRAHSLDTRTDEKGEVLTKTGAKYDYRYLTLNKLHKQVMPLLNELGLVWCTFPTEVDGKPALRYTLAFAKRAEGEVEPEKVQGVMLLILDRNNSQGQGSAITYARRQALVSVLGLVPDDDDDGQAAGDERLIVSRLLTVDELARTREAFAEAGLDFGAALKTVEAKSGDEVTLAQGHQLRGILRMHTGADS